VATGSDTNQGAIRASPDQRMPIAGDSIKMGAAATSQSYSESSPRFKSVTKLMQQLGIEGGYFEAVPKDQLVTFMSPIYKPPRRILAWVHERTLCYPALSPFCVDEKRNVLHQKDCLKELNERAIEFSKEHGTKPVVLDKSIRGFEEMRPGEVRRRARPDLLMRKGDTIAGGLQIIG
jgi:hypothetical protein